MWRPLIIIFLQIAIQLQLLGIIQHWRHWFQVPGQSCTSRFLPHVSQVYQETRPIASSVSNFAVRHHPPPKTIRISLFDTPWPRTESGYQHLTQQTFIYKHRSTRLAWTLHDTECSGAAWHGGGVVVVWWWWWWYLLGAQFSESFAAAAHNAACAAPRQVIVHTLTGRLSRHRAAPRRSHQPISS